MKRFPILVLAWGALALSGRAQAILQRTTLSAGSLDSSAMTITLGEPIAYGFDNGTLGAGAQPGDELITVGTLEQGDLTGVAVFPNPTGAILNVVFDAETPSRSQGQLFDAAGRLVLTAVFDNRANALDLQKLAAGPYALRLLSGEKSTTVQIIKH